MMNGFKFVFFAMIIFSSLANAMSADEQDNYNDIQAEYKKSDSELNAIYKKQIDEFKRQGAEFYGQKESRDVYLKKSQQVWVKMRDASCDYETYESKSGTGYSSIYEKCLLDKTNERISYLKENN